jgi:hypothetical protein
MATALMIMLLASLFVAAYASVLTTRAHQTTFTDSAIKRRIALENSRALSHQLMLERIFDTASSEAADQTGAFSSAWGATNTGDGWSNVDTFAASSLPASLTTVYPYNYTGMRTSGSFLVTERTVWPPPGFAGALPEGEESFNAWSFIKTYTPGLGGDPLVIYRKPDAAAGQIEIGTSGTTTTMGLHVEGRAVIRDAASFFAPSTARPLELNMRVKSLYIQEETPNDTIYCKDVYGNPLVPSNLASVKTTTGPVPEGTGPAYLYNNTLNVINNPANPSNSLWHFMDRERTAATGDYETINTGSVIGTGADPWRIEHQLDPTYKPPAWPSGYPPVWKVLFIKLDHPDLKHLRIESLVDQVVFEGQDSGAKHTAATTMSPLIFLLVPNGAGLNTAQDMRFVNENGRRIVLGVKDGNATKLDMYWEGVSDITGNSFVYDWRLALVNEYRTLWANMPLNVLRSVSLSGGVLTNWSLLRRGVGSASRFVLRNEDNPEPAGAVGTQFSKLLPREGWIENYFLPTPP